MLHASAARKFFIMPKTQRKSRASTNAGSRSSNRSGAISPTTSTQQETSVVTTTTVSTQQQVPITTTVPTQQQVARSLTLNDVSLIAQEVVKYVPQLLGLQPIQITQPATINRLCEPAVIFPQSGPPQGVTTTSAINEPDGVRPPG